ncbi:hypothetical protein PIROE2DRAFT_13903 [Piromyces sp. E2]|nr:hypothetical protein PIROE2DRAFT_13903 [Piromyces sp. E2]|eukprot:OUM60357.1 hypothetical protein PIROE2DRAFT_13903 [Piromyces sp. E2]
MLKYTLFLIIAISLFVLNVNALSKTIKKDDILSMESQSCKEDSDCMNHGNFCSSDRCIESFYCQGNDCIIPDENAQYVNLVSDNSFYDQKPQGMIIEACSVEVNKKGNCATRLCDTNSDCFSNLCMNRTCIINENLPLLVCSNEGNDKKFSCGKIELEKCEKNEECFYGTCNEDKTCNDKFPTKIDEAVTSVLLKYILIGVAILVVIIVLIVFLVKRCRKH